MLNLGDAVVKHWTSKQKEGGGGKNSATELMNDLVAQLTIENIQTELQYAQPTNFKVVL